MIGRESRAHWRPARQSRNRRVRRPRSTSSRSAAQIARRARGAQANLALDILVPVGRPRQHLPQLADVKRSEQLLQRPFGARDPTRQRPPACLAALGGSPRGRDRARRGACLAAQGLDALGCKHARPDDTDHHASSDGTPRASASGRRRGRR
jgi:hypothetical protein